MTLSCGCLESIKSYLIQFDVNINEDTNGKGWTALHQACRHEGQLPILKYLLDNGANIEATTIRKETPLIVAVQNGNETAVCLLLKRGANIQSINENGSTSLHLACHFGDDAVVGRPVPS